ncbi:NAD(P)-dependent oxidoreductase [Motilimonas pumila]|nr:NAD(P)-dependent oxidoreductase [Motilimonas pumila]
MTTVFLDRGTIPNHITMPNSQWQLFDETHDTEVLARIIDAEVIISNKVKLQRQHLQHCRHLKLIVIAATGTNNVDLNYCKQQGIQVSNIQHYADEGVPEHAIAMLLALAKKLIPYHQATQEGHWQQAKQFCYYQQPISNLAGKTLAIIGQGALGQAIAQLAKAFGMQVIFAERKGATVIRAGKVKFEDALSQADAVSLHCPLSQNNADMFGPLEFALMKSSAYFINTARGGLVNETALVNAVLSNQIAGAATDVAVTEPLAAGSPLEALFNADNFIITPHVAWASDESLHNLVTQIDSIISAHQQGEAINQVT